VPTARVKGISSLGGRKVLVTEISGEATREDGERRLLGTTTGYDAIDLQTGISVQSAVRFHIEPYGEGTEK